MEVVEEDSLRTELKRNKPSPGKIINIWQVKQRSAATAKPREESTELSAQRRLSAPPSWASLSPLSADSHVAVVPRGSAHTSMRRPAPSLGFLENVIRDSVTYTEHARRKTVTA